MKNKEFTATTPQEEQETIITYDRKLDEWNLYTDVPKHARKWQERIIPEREIYNKSTNQLIGIEGKIKGSVSINKFRVMSDEQKKKASERMKKMHSKPSIAIN